MKKRDQKSSHHRPGRKLSGQTSSDRRLLRSCARNAVFCSAGSSEMFGTVREVSQRDTPLLLVPCRDAMFGYLKSKGIDAAIHYRLPVQRQPAYLKQGYREIPLPVTEQVADEVISDVSGAYSRADRIRSSDCQRSILMARIALRLN